MSAKNLNESVWSENTADEQAGVIYEITRKLSNPAQAKTDMGDAMELVTNMFRERYLSRMNEAAAVYMENARSKPPKEANLLYSLKPFLAETNHANVDKTAEMFIFMDAFKKLAAGVAPEESPLQAQEAVRDSSVSIRLPLEESESGIIHSDGVYEIDEQCLAQKNRQPHSGIMTGLLMMSFMKGFGSSF